jgi:hypothetical protein
MTQLVMTAISLVVVGGVLLWRAHSASEPATLTTTPTVTAGSQDEGVPPMGGLAERYRDQERGQLSSAPPFGDVALTDRVQYARIAAAERTETAPTATPTLYLVGSSEQQQALTALGLAANETVVMVTTDDEVAQVKEQHGLLGAAVIDLRPPVVATHQTCEAEVHQLAC